MTTTAEVQVVVSLTLDEILSINEKIDAYLSNPQCGALLSAMDVAAVRQCLKKFKTAVAMMGSEEAPSSG